ncbi:DUF5753 domain-containing protein [Embleya sp. AB8]|uniref:DUF5753 domain-containing protein n=1 Tax=Embleya sp. AB8 TaxID=3156304 RepID=UPI003C783735
MEALGFQAPYDLGSVRPPAVAPSTVAALGQGEADGPRNVPERLNRLLPLEQQAISLRCYETLMIPGLLQSPAYALSAIQMRLPTVRSAVAYERMRIRMQRSERLLWSGRPASFVISEAALYQPIGGLAVLGGQMEHLLMLTSQHPQVSVQVLPLDAAFVLPSPCLLLEVSPGRTVAWLEQLTDSLLVESPDEVMFFQTAFERLSMMALSSQATPERIDERRRALCTAVEVTAHASSPHLRARPSG